MKIFIILLLGLAAVKGDKIVGGVDAGGPISYQARMQYLAGGIRCGGSLIDTQWVLSAAHCYSSTFGTWRIVLGEYDSSTTSETTTQTFTISQLIQHPDYSSSTQDSDVMLVKLGGIATISGTVSTIALPSQSTSTSSPAVGTDCLVSGWGTTSSGGSTSDVLQKVTVNVVDQGDCNQDYRLYGGITDTMICLAASGKDSCQGDSGGPAVCDGVLHGVVSWGVGCANSRYPGVYSRVQALSTWIQNTMTEN